MEKRVPKKFPRGQEFYEFTQSLRLFTPVLLIQNNNGLSRVLKRLMKAVSAWEPDAVQVR